MTELTFTPATIVSNGRTLPGNLYGFLWARLEQEGYEYDEDVDGRLLIGVPANHDSVFAVGPYTITLDR